MRLLWKKKKKANHKINQAENLRRERVLGRSPSSLTVGHLTYWVIFLLTVHLSYEVWSWDNSICLSMVGNNWEKLIATSWMRGNLVFLSLEAWLGLFVKSQFIGIVLCVQKAHHHFVSLSLCLMPQNHWSLHPSSEVWFFKNKNILSFCPCWATMSPVYSECWQCRTRVA